MSHRKLLSIVLGWIIFGLLLIACGAPKSQPTPSPTMIPPTPTPTMIPPTSTPAPFAKEGHWESVGDAVSPVSFDVTANGKIRDFNILIGGDCDVTVIKDIPIMDNHEFIFGELDAEGKPTNNGIIGTFDTPTTVSGSFDSSWECPLSTGGIQYTYFPEQGAVWAAEWQEP